MFTAASIVSEIGDISKFKKAKQLVAYFGLDTNVNQSGKYISKVIKFQKEEHHMEEGPYIQLL